MFDVNILEFSSFYDDCDVSCLNESAEADFYSLEYLDVKSTASRHQVKPIQNPRTRKVKSSNTPPKDDLNKEVVTSFSMNPVINRMSVDDSVIDKRLNVRQVDSVFDNIVDFEGGLNIDLNASRAFDLYKQLIGCLNNKSNASGKNPFEEIDDAIEKAMCKGVDSDKIYIALVQFLYPMRAKLKKWDSLYRNTENRIKSSAKLERFKTLYP